MSSDELLDDKWLKKLDRQSQAILDRVVLIEKLLVKCLMNEIFCVLETDF